VDVLTELNKLNKLFQSDHVDITQIGGHLNICITVLSRRFLTVRGAAFGRGSRVLWPFLETCATSMEMVYPLADGGQRTYAMHLGSVTERPGTIEECKFIGAEYVQRVVDALNNKFPDLGIFNACKLFSPNLYPANDDERTRITEEWLERLFVKFHTSEEEQDRCRGECLEMVERP
jgi:hypothetical protein